MNNRKNNKGFSLVELIVVVAIMAVLVGVLAPAYLRYVEKSKLQKDVSAVGEVVEAIQVAGALENVSTQIGSRTVTVNVTSGQAPATTAGGTALDTELAATIGTVNITSDTLKKAGAITIDVSKNASGNLVIDVKPDSVAELEALDVN